MDFSISALSSAVSALVLVTWIAGVAVPAVPVRPCFCFPELVGVCYRRLISRKIELFMVLVRLAAAFTMFFQSEVLFPAG
jgi:hypothetical protein